MMGSYQRQMAQHNRPGTRTVRPRAVFAEDLPFSSIVGIPSVSHVPDDMVALGNVEIGVGDMASDTHRDAFFNSLNELVGDINKHDVYLGMHRNAGHETVYVTVYTTKEDQ